MVKLELRDFEATEVAALSTRVEYISMSMSRVRYSIRWATGTRTSSAKQEIECAGY